MYVYIYIYTYVYNNNGTSTETKGPGFGSSEPRLSCVSHACVEILKIMGMLQACRRGFASEDLSTEDLSKEIGRNPCPPD